MATINFKRGDTFSLSCVYKVDDVASSVSAIDIKAQLRDSDTDLVQELAVSKLVGTGQFVLLATAAQTQNWDLNLLKCDIQFTQNDVVRSSSTFFVNVTEDITK